MVSLSLYGHLNKLLFRGKRLFNLISLFNITSCIHILSICNRMVTWCRADGIHTTMSTSYPCLFNVNDNMYMLVGLPLLPYPIGTTILDYSNTVTLQIVVKSVIIYSRVPLRQQTVSNTFFNNRNERWSLFYTTPRIPPEYTNKKLGRGGWVSEACSSCRQSSIIETDYKSVGGLREMYLIWDCLPPKYRHSCVFHPNTDTAVSSRSVALNKC